MTQTNNGLGETLLGLAGAALVKGRISAGGRLGFQLVLHMAYDRQGQYCVRTFVSPLSRCTSAGTSVSLGKYLVSSSETRTHKEWLVNVLYCAVQPRMFVPVRPSWDIHLEGMTQAARKKNKCTAEVLLTKM